MRSTLIKIFENADKSYSLGELKRILHLKNNENKNINKTLEDVLCNLELDGKVYYDEYENRYYAFPSNFFITQIECTKKGCLIINYNGSTYNFTENQMKGVMPFDTVILEKLDKGFRLVKILKRFNPQVICELEENGKVKIVGNQNIDVRLDKKILKNLTLPVGTRFLANLKTEELNGVFDLEYIKIMGHKNDLNAELEAIAYNNGFQTRYTNEEIAQVDAMPTVVSEEDKIGRIDRTEENIFTIDGKHTKDMDDAISIKILSNGNYQLIVSIAAVNHYIKFGSPLWLRAERNTTSLYLIQSVAHMLHFKVSNGICSLNPGVERLAKSFVMEIDSKGNVVDFKFEDSVIKSKKKMTYEDVNKILENNEIPEGYENFIDDLNKMYELSQILSNRRIKDGSLEFDGKEIVFILDDEQNIKSVEVKKQGPAEKIIENFMVVTNESMAEYMLNLGLTFIYRNHEIPITEKVRETAKLIKSLGNKIENIKDFDDPHVTQKIITSIRSKEEFFILSTLLLKSMQKAYFSAENQGHFGLALRAYSQTTSPIRRFLDLLIQYILDNLDDFYDPNFDFEEFKKYVNSMCERASNLERCANKAEYEANKLYMVDYVLNRPDMEFVGFVQDITPRYVLVKTKELIEGIVYFDDIDDGNFTYNPESKWLVGENGTKIIIGLKLTLKLKECNREYRTISFSGITPNRMQQESLKRIKKS